MEKSESIGQYDDPLAKYENIDPSKYAIDLNVYQVAYLHKLLGGNTFRFQPEETAKKKIQTLKKNLSKKRSAKSVNTESMVSNSDKDSLSERKVSMPKAMQPRKPSPPKSVPKPANRIPDNLKLSYQRLQEAKNEVNRKLVNIAREIDFESLEKGIQTGTFSSPQEFESTTKQIFGAVIKRYEGVTSIHKSLTGILRSLITTEEHKAEVEPPRATAPITPPQQTSMQNNSNMQQSQSSIAENQGYVGKPQFPFPPLSC